MTAEREPISKGRVIFSELELGVPLTFTAIDATTKTLGSFTILPIGKFESKMESTVFRFLDGEDFAFNLSGSDNQPFQVKIGSEFTITSSGHLVNRLEHNHYDKEGIQLGQELDLGFEYFDGDDLHHIAAHKVDSMTPGEKVESYDPPDMSQFASEIKSAGRL